MGGWFWVGEWMDDEGLGWLGGWIVMGRRMGDVWWIDVQMAVRMDGWAGTCILMNGWMDEWNDGHKLKGYWK